MTHISVNTFGGNGMTIQQILSQNKIQFEQVQDETYVDGVIFIEDNIVLTPTDKSIKYVIKNYNGEDDSGKNVPI